MKQIVPEKESANLLQQLSALEKQSDTEIVLTTVQRSDSYPEIPWKAFALGVSVTGLAVFLTDILLMSWVSASTILLSMVITLGAGLLLVLLTIIYPPFARLFIVKNRAETETRQYAESLFLKRELFQTSGRKGILVLISLFEKKVVIHTDTGISHLLKEEIIQGIINRMRPQLARKDVAGALETLLEELTKVLVANPPKGKALNELPDEIIEEKGI